MTSGDLFDGNLIDGTGTFPYKVESISSDITSVANAQRTTEVTITSTTPLNNTANNMRVVRGVEAQLVLFGTDTSGNATGKFTIKADDPDELLNPSEGKMEAGIDWKVELAGIVYKYTTMDGDTDASVAAQFLHLIQGINPDREDVKFSDVERLTVRTGGGNDIIRSDDTAVETIVEQGPAPTSLRSDPCRRYRIAGTETPKPGWYSDRRCNAHEQR